MKTIQIRHKTFETNSSSSHSFFIPSKQFRKEIPFVNDEGVVEVNIRFREEWGWEWDSFNTFDDKINYIAASMAYSLSTNEATSPVRYVQKEKIYVIDCHIFQNMMSRITKLILDVTGADRVEYNLLGLSTHIGDNGKTTYNNTISPMSIGYIDHESAHLMSASTVAAMTDDQLQTALFDPNSILITGNDNSDMEEESKAIFYEHSDRMQKSIKEEFKNYIRSEYFFSDDEF